MLSASAAWVAPAAAGLGGLPMGDVALPAAGLAGLAAAAIFAALLGALLGPQARPGGMGNAAQDGWAPGIQGRVAALCAGGCALIGLLAAGLAWAVWELQGPGRALGLMAGSLAFVSAALAFGSRARRRR